MNLLLLIVLIILIAGGIPGAPWPTYPHTFGYAPAGVLGTVLVVLLILMLLGRL